MSSDWQRKFFILEFSSWTDRFLRYMSAAMIALLGVVLVQTFFSIGGVDAQYLVYTFGLLTLAVGAQILVFWARIGRGFRVSGFTMCFLPWLGLLWADALWLSDTPWRAQYALCLNLLPIMAFFVAIHGSRTKRLRWWIVSLTAMVVLASGLAEFLYGENTDPGGSSFGHTMRSVFSTFGNSTAMGAVLLLAFFAMVMLVVSPRFKLWSRLFGFYVGVLFLLGIVFTRNFGVYLGLFAGGVLATWLLVRKKTMRAAIWAALVCGVAIASLNTETRIGCLTEVPVSRDILEHFSEDERRANTRYLLPHAALEMFKEHPFFGVGAGQFGSEFEKYRTPQWQTEPQTAGSLYLTILAENGIVGCVLFLAPMGVLFFFALRACRRMPWLQDTERARVRRKMGMLDFGALPEERIALAATLCGLFAVGVLFAVDYPKNFPGVSIACGIFGGIAAYLSGREHRRTIIYSGGRRHWLLPAAFVAPVVCLAVCLPTFRTEAEYQKGVLLLQPFYANANTGTTKEGLDFNDLATAETHLRIALRKSPGHGDAWNALSAKYVFDCQRDPINTAMYGCFLRETSRQALACSQSVPEFFRMRAVSDMMTGNYDAVKSELSRAVEMAPFKATALLECAEIYRSFPQGVGEAATLLERAQWLLPKSSYVESMLSLLHLGETGGGDATDIGDEYVIPEF